MESSRFVQLSSSILVEYIYTDQADPTIFNTDTFPIEIMRDEHTNGSYFFNTANVASTMGNYRDISAVAINKNKTIYASLNTSVGVPYNDFDPKLTPTNQLVQSFAPNLNIEYDRIKIHFIAGFNFEDFDGIIFDITTQRRDGVTINLAAINFLRTDTPVFNADPFLLGGKLYATNIEWRVPALFYMNNSFVNTNPNLLSYKLTEGRGFIPTPPITITVKGISQIRVENGFDFYDVQEINSVSILSRDIYDNLFAQVIESEVGDYFEITGQVLGSSLANFIATLNSQGGNYVAFHDVRVSEQIETNFIQTSVQAFTQTTDFDNPILFRPIILNSAIAVSFSIDYTLRLFNRDDSTQIIKRARLLSFDVKKYGRRLMKINLGTVPTVAKVYNRLQPDDGRQIIIGGTGVTSAQTSNQISKNLVVRTQYVTSFRDRLNVKASISPVKIQNITE